MYIVTDSSPFFFVSFLTSSLDRMGEGGAPCFVLRINKKVTDYLMHPSEWRETRERKKKSDRKPRESFPDSCLLFWHYSLGVQL